MRGWFVLTCAVALVACEEKKLEETAYGTEAAEANAEEVPLDPFSNDKVHTVDIEVAPDDLPALDADRTVKVPCSITIDGIRFEGATIREKGSIGSSSDLDGKPSFHVQFGKQKRPKGLKKITFHNAKQDPSFVHEHLGYEMYRAGIPAPRTGHGALALNARDYGIYVVVEPVDEKSLKREFGNGDGNLYEGNGHDFIEGAANHEFLELKEEEDGRSLLARASCEQRVVRHRRRHEARPRSLHHGVRARWRDGPLGRAAIQPQQLLPLLEPGRRAARAPPARDGSGVR